MDYITRLEALKDSLDKAKLNKVKYEERLNILLKDREKIIEEIKNLESKIASDIAKAEDLIRDNE